MRSLLILILMLFLFNNVYSQAIDSIANVKIDNTFNNLKEYFNCELYLYNNHKISVASSIKHLNNDFYYDKHRKMVYLDKDLKVCDKIKILNNIIIHLKNRRLYEI